MTSQYPSEVAPWDKIQLPPVSADQWRGGASALLAYMTPEGRARALAEWDKAGYKVAAPAVALPPLPEAGGLLDCFTVLDLEFQGTELLEVAAIRYEHWQPVEQLQSFVRFRGEINGFVYKVTGITKDLTWNAPEEKTVLQRFKALAGDSVLVAHNVLTADKRVLEAARARCGATQELTNGWLCTMALAKHHERNGLLPKGQKTGLSDLCLHFGIDSRGHHQALRDVQMCYQVLRCLHAQATITELITSTAKPKAMGTGQLFATAA